MIATQATLHHVINSDPSLPSGDTTDRHTHTYTFGPAQAFKEATQLILE